MRFLKLIAVFCATTLVGVTAVGQETGPAGSVLRVPAAGGKAKMGPVDLSSANATTNRLNALTKLNGLTTGSCIFGGASGVINQEATSDCFWDTTGKSFSIGNASPSASAKVQIDSITKGFLIPRMTATQRDAIASPASGLQVYNTDANQIEYYNGSVWLSTGSGGSGGGGNNNVEYISNGKAESGISGWARYADTPGVTPVDGTGGSPSIVLSRTTSGSEVIRETASFKMAKTSSDLQGQGISYDFKIDPQDYKNIAYVYVSFDYKTTANYVSSDVVCSVYDKDAGTLITLYDGNGLSGALPADLNGKKFTGFFYPVNSTSDDYRFICHIATTNALAYDFIYDSVHVGSGKSGFGTYITNTKKDNSALSFTGFGTTSDPNIFVTRFGDRIFVKGYFRAGTVTASSAELNLSGFTIDPNKLGTGTSKQAVGKWASLRTSASNTQTYSGDNGGSIFYDGSSTNKLFLQRAVTALSFDKAAVNTLVDTNGYMSIEFDVPVSTWTASASLNTIEMDTTSAKFTNTATAQAVSSTSQTLVQWSATATIDNLTWWDSSNWSYKVRRKGRYLVDAALALSNATAEYYYISMYVNGVNVKQTGYSATSPALDVTATLDLAANDYIQIFVKSTADAAYDIVPGSSAWFSVTEQPDLSSVLAPGGVSTRQVFTSSGTWSDVGCKYIDVLATGGGGAGGGTSATAYRNGGGGGGGATGKKRMLPGTYTPSVAVTIGAGGAGTNGNGNVGGTSSFGSYLTAGGGSGGSGNFTQGTGAAGSSTTTGADITISGQGGSSGYSPSPISWGGTGGGSYSGGGMRGPVGDNAGISADGYGGGGSGASNAGVTTARLGGAGGDGIVIVDCVR